VFSSVLYQRGAPHSRDPRKAKNAQNRREEADRFTWLYRNSLFRAFVLLFVFSLTLHIAFGTNAYNEERALIGQPPISVAAFLLSAKFWSSTLQTWQAEYLAIALFVVLSIFLRQQDSAESKPVESRNQTTGEANMYDTPRTKKPLVIRDRHVGRNTPQQRAVAVPSANLAGVTAFLMQGLRPAG